MCGLLICFFWVLLFVEGSFFRVYCVDVFVWKFIVLMLIWLFWFWNGIIVLYVDDVGSWNFWGGDLWVVFFWVFCLGVFFIFFCVVLWEVCLLFSRMSEWWLLVLVGYSDLRVRWCLSCWLLSIWLMIIRCVIVFCSCVWFSLVVCILSGFGRRYIRLRLLFRWLMLFMIWSFLMLIRVIWCLRWWLRD